MSNRKLPAARTTVAPPVRPLRAGDLVTLANAPYLAQVIAVEGDGVILTDLIHTETDTPADPADLKNRYGWDARECRLVPAPPLPVPGAGGPVDRLRRAFPDNEALANVLTFQSELLNLMQRVRAFERAGGKTSDNRDNIAEVIGDVIEGLSFIGTFYMLTGSQPQSVVELTRRLVDPPERPLVANLKENSRTIDGVEPAAEPVAAEPREEGRSNG